MAKEKSNPDPNPKKAEGKKAKATKETAAELEELKKKQEELEGKVHEYEEMIKRQQAEFDNFRKRTVREKEEIIKDAGVDVLKDLLNVTDNFERALKIDVNEENKGFIEGFQMIENQLKDLLSNHNVREIDGVGHPFDPGLHQAIQMEEKEGEEVETVSEVYQRGYCINDRVLRHATVKIIKPAASEENAEGGVPDPALDKESQAQEKQ